MISEDYATMVYNIAIIASKSKTLIGKGAIKNYEIIDKLYKNKEYLELFIYIRIISEQTKEKVSTCTQWIDDRIKYYKETKNYKDDYMLKIIAEEIKDLINNKKFKSILEVYK